MFRCFRKLYRSAQAGWKTDRGRIQSGDDAGVLLATNHQFFLQKRNLYQILKPV
jgi:hypothetical protein